MSQYEVATLKKGLQILDVLMERGEMTLNDVMHTFNWNKTSTYRLLYTLEAMNFIEKNGEWYKSSEKMSGAKQPHNPMVDWIGVPPLSRMSEELGETMYIGILDGTDVITTQIVNSSRAIRVHTEVGDRDPAHGSALGKAILAFLDPTTQQKFLRQLQLNKQTDNTFDDEQLFFYHLKAIRNQGYAIDDEETEIGLRCIATPIYQNGKVVASVAVSGPASRVSKQQDTYFSKKIIQCSQQITENLQMNDA